MLIPLLSSLFTHDCMARHNSNTIIKFADNTTAVGLITDTDKTAYREEVRDLAGWSQNNNLSLNATKTKEMIVDYRKRSTEHDRKALQRVMRTAQYITGEKLPAIQDLYTRRCQRKGLKIVKDPSHPSHRLFSLLPHGKRYRNAKSRTKRLLNSFYPQAISLLNRQPNAYPDYLHSFTMLLLSVYLICLVTLTIPSCT